MNDMMDCDSKELDLMTNVMFLGELIQRAGKMSMISGWSKFSYLSFVVHCLKVCCYYLLFFFFRKSHL